MRMTRPLGFLAASVGVVAVLAGCGGSASAGTSKSPSAKATPSISRSTQAKAPVTTASATPVTADGQTTVTVDGVTVSGAAGAQPSVTVTPGTATPTDVVVQDVTVGTGAEIKPNGAGTFNYEGLLFSDGSTFDSSWTRGQPVSFSLDQVIPGWQAGIPGMKEGGRRLLIVPPAYAYGYRAQPGIPPNSTLVFVVDLQKVNGS